MFANEFLWSAYYLESSGKTRDFGRLSSVLLDNNEVCGNSTNAWQKNSLERVFSAMKSWQ